MSVKRRLVMNVAASNGDWYGPDYPANELTPEVEAEITNPKAWGEKPAADGPSVVPAKAEAVEESVEDTPKRVVKGKASK